MSSSLGERLGALCTANDWSKTDLARELGVTKQAACFYLDDERYPRNEPLERAADLLRTPVGRLYAETVRHPRRVAAAAARRRATRKAA